MVQGGIGGWGELGCAMPLGEEAVMADAVEAIGQGVEKEFGDLGTSMPRPVQCNNTSPFRRRKFKQFCGRRFHVTLRRHRALFESSRSHSHKTTFADSAPRCAN